MAGDSLGGLVVKISGDMAELKTAMDKSTYLVEQSYNQMTRAGDRLISSFKAVAVAAGVGISVVALKNMAEQAIHAADAIDDLQEKVGGSASAWSGLIDSARISGVAFETMEQGAVRLARAMSGSEVETKGSSKAFEFLGVSVRDASGNMRATEQVMVDVARALNKYEDGAGKAAIAQDIFGKGGAALLPALKQIAQDGERVGSVTDEMAKSADAYGKDLIRLAIAKESLGRVITFQMLPAVNAVVIAMTEMATRTDSASGAAKAMASDGTLAAWAWNTAKGVAVLTDGLKTFIGFAGQAGNVSKIFGDQAIEGLPFGEQLKSLIQMTDAGKDWNKQIVEAKANYRAFLDSTSKSMLDLIRLQQQATEALKLTGPQYLDARDLRANPAIKQSAGGYTSGTPKGKTDTADAIKENKEYAEALKFLGDQLNALNGIEKNYAEGLRKLLTLWNAGIISAKTLEQLEEQLWLTETKAGKATVDHAAAMQKLEAETLKLAAAMRQLAEDTKDRYQAELAGAKLTSEALAFQNTLYGKSAAEQAKLTIEFEAHRKLAADLAAIYKQWGDAGLDNVDVAAASSAAWATFNETISRTPEAIKAIENAQDALVRNMEFEVSLIGLTNTEREKAIALRTLDTTGIDKQSEAYAGLAARIKAAIETRELRNTLIDLRDSLTDTIIAAFDADGIRGAVKLFIDWLKGQFEKLVLRPLIEPIAGSAASLVLALFGYGASGSAAAGVAGSSAGSVGNLFSLGSGIANNGSTALNWLTGAGAAGTGELMSVNGVLQPISIGTASNGFWSAGSLGNVGTAGGLAGTAALGAAAGYFITPYLSKDEDAANNGAIGGGAGAVIGSYLAAGTAVGGPWGAVIGAVVGILIAAFSDADGPAMRTAAVVAGHTLDKYTYALESKLGTLGIAKGSDQWFSDSEMGETLDAWFKTIQDIDNSIADRLTDAQLIAARLAVNSGSMTMGFGVEHQDIDPAAFGRIIQDRYGKIFGAIDATMGALITGFSGTTGDLLKLVDDLATINYQLNVNGAALAKVFGETIDFADIQAFNVVGETYAATLQRLGSVFYATNAIAVMLGKTQEDVWGTIGLASEAARQALIEAAGGLDAFTAHLSSYYQHFYTAEERLQHTHAQLAASFADLSVAMPTTLQGFRSLVESFDLTTEGGRAAYTALMAIEAQFYDFVTAANAAGEAVGNIAGSNRSVLRPRLEETTAAMNGMGGALFGLREGLDRTIVAIEGAHRVVRGPAVDDLGRAAAVAHENLVRLNEALRNSFQDAYRSIEMDGLSDQEKYRYLQREAAGYTVNLQSAGTGDEVQKWAQKIKDDMLAAYNLLDPAERALRKQEFLDNLLKIEEMATARLTQLDPTGSLSNTFTEPAAAAAEAQNNAASTQREAAQMQKQAAADMQEAAKAMIIANQLIKRIQIDLPNQGVTVEAGA